MKRLSNMLMEIGTVDRIPEYIAKAKDKNDPFRLMGFGHRVYKNYDPRARIMQKTMYEVLEATGHGDDPLMKVALELEKIALNDPYFVEKKLYPNVDFYSGITLRALGFPRPCSPFSSRSPHRRLGRAVERNDRRPAAAHRPSAPALHGRSQARLCKGREALSALDQQHQKPAIVPAFFVFSIGPPKSTGASR